MIKEKRKLSAKKILRQLLEIPDKRITQYGLDAVEKMAKDTEKYKINKAGGADGMMSDRIGILTKDGRKMSIRANKTQIEYFNFLRNKANNK